LKTKNNAVTTVSRERLKVELAQLKHENLKLETELSRLQGSGDTGDLLLKNDLVLERERDKNK
jgi:hypothetical protein